MKKTMRLFVLLGAVAPLVVMAASSESTAQTNTTAAKPTVTTSTLFTNTIVAKGKGVSVTRSELDQELIRIKATLAAQGQPVPGDSAMVERQVLDGMINKELLLAKTTEADKTKGQEQFEASLQKFKTAARLTDEEFNQKLSQQLRLQDMTKQQWEQQGMEQATLPILLERELKIDVTEDQARKFYDENPARFERPEMVRAAHILLMTSDPVTRKELSDEQKAAKRKQMEDILKRVRAGEDFAKLAKEYSEDPGSKDKGGEYTFARGQMMPEFEAAAFSLSTNRVSNIVTTPYGYHIIKLYEKIPAKKTDFAALETKTILVKPDGQNATIREILSEQAMQKQIPEYVQKLRKDAGVQILDERLNSVEVPTPAAPGKSENMSEAAKK